MKKTIAQYQEEVSQLVVNLDSRNAEINKLKNSRQSKEIKINELTAKLNSLTEKVDAYIRLYEDNTIYDHQSGQLSEAVPMEWHQKAFLHLQETLARDYNADGSIRIKSRY